MSILAQSWLGALLAPIGWIADFLVRYMVVRFANIQDRRWPMSLSTAMGTVMVLLGALICWRIRRRGAPGEAATIAGWGLGLAGFFLLLILAQAFPTLLLGPREIT